MSHRCASVAIVLGMTSCGRIAFDPRPIDDAAHAVPDAMDAAGSTIAYMQSTPEGRVFPGPSQAVSFGSVPSAGDTIIVDVSAFNANASVTWPPTGVVDDQGNTYAVAVAASDHNAVGYFADAIYYSTPIGATAGTFTVTAMPSVASAITMVAVEYAGLASANPVDVTASNTGASANASSGTTAPTAQADELAVAVLGFTCNSGTCTVTIPAGYAVRLTEANSAWENVEAADAILSTIGTQSAAWTTGGAGNSPPDYVACIATFKAD